MTRAATASISQVTALRERGYIRFYPYGDNGRGSWGAKRSKKP